MPIKTNVLERTAFFTLNAAPGPMLDLAGALAFQTISTAVHLGLFAALEAAPQTAAQLAKTLDADERGVTRLLDALEAIGYVQSSNGRFANSAMTRKWFSEGAGIDMVSAVSTWDVFLRQLWPHAPEVIQSGERPYNFYEFIAADPALSHAFQQMMVGNANLTGPDIVRKLPVPGGPTSLLDVGGGHGAFAIEFCQAYPELRATVVDSAAALETAKLLVSAAGLSSRIALQPGDLWELDWGGPHDLLLLFNLLHHYDAPTNEALLARARTALKPGGRVAILEQVEGHVSGPAANAIVRLVALMYHLFADGRVYEAAALSDMLQKNGFQDIRVHTLSKAPGNSLITAAAA